MTTKLVAGRKNKRGRPDKEWEREVEGWVKEKNLSSEDAVNRQV
jgi:hypothetical protein